MCFDVMSGRRPCPLAATCEKYAKARAEGKRMVGDVVDEVDGQRLLFPETIS